MKIAEAYVEIETNQAKFGKELKTMESAVKKSTDRMKKNFDRIGQGVSQISSTARIGFLAMSAAIVGSVYALVSAGDEIHKMSIRTGIAAKELSALGYAARISGADLDTVERSLRYLSAKMMDADQGLAEAQRSFERLGISVKDVDGSLRPTIDVLKEAADKISAMTNETEKSALAGEIFGMRYGPMLIPLLEEGSAGITDLMNKAEELGITIDTSSAKAAAEFKDRLEDMKGALGGLTREIGEIFLPVFRNSVVIIIDKVKEWRRAMESITPQQKKLIAQIVLLGTAALGAVGALGLFAKVAVVVKAAGLIIAGTAGLIASPLGLILLAVGALAVAWAYNWGDIQGKTKAVWEVLEPIFKAIWDWLGKAWEWSLKNVPKAWDWLTDTLWPKLKEIFQGIWDWLTKAWDWNLDKVKNAWEWFEETLIPFLKEWGKATLEWTLEKIGTVWDTVVRFFNDAKDWFVAKFSWTLEKIGKAWDTIIGFFDSVKDWLKAKFSWTLEKIGAVWDTIMEFFSGVKDWIKAKFSWTLEKMGPIWDAIIGFFADAKDWLTKKFSWTLEKAGEMWDWFTNTLIPMLWSWSETTFHWLLELGGTVWDKFKDIMQWVEERATMFFNWSLIKIGETWDWLTDKLWPWIKEWGTKAFEWGLELMGDIWNWLKDTLIPWVKDWKEKTFEWTLNLLGDAWDKIKELLESLKIIPEELEGVAEAAEKTGEAIKKIVPAKIIKDLSHLEGQIRGQRIALEYASKGWEGYKQDTKRQIAATAANFILFEHKITDIAAKAPYEFSERFQKAFMKAKPKIQKAILDALLSGDFERALSLAGVKAGKAFLGRSPGMLTELESGRKDMEKILDRMTDSMGNITKEIMKALQPIIGLFKKMFEGITDMMIKSENETISQMGKDIKAFVDDILAMMQGLFDALEMGADEATKKIWRSFDVWGKDMVGELSFFQKLWQTFCANLEENWKRITGVFKAAFWDAVTGIIAGTQTITEAFKSLQAAVAVELAKIAVAAAKTGDYVSAAIAGVAAAFTVLGIRIRETTTHFETAWGTWGRNVRIAGERVHVFAEELETQFNRVGLAISKTIEDAQYKLEGLYQSQADLGASTTEKLISELDKYYDYRVLKEMSLTELLELSAKTRAEIEAGTIQEVEESEEEQEARRKDRAISRLQQIEDQYKKEDELLRRKIALTEIEIKLLEYKLEREAHGNSARAKMLAQELEDMLEAYHLGVEAFKEAEKEKQEAVKGTTEEVKKETEDMGKSWDDLTRDTETAAKKTWGRTGTVPIALIEAINAMIEKIGELPTEVLFDVIGNLHMPEIPGIATRYFDIFGTYHAPSIPSYQVGIPYVPRTTLAVLHRGEEVKPAHRARSKAEGNVTQFGDIIMHAEFPNVDLETLTKEKIERIFQKKFVPAIEEAVRRGVFSRDLVGVRRVR